MVKLLDDAELEEIVKDTGWTKTGKTGRKTKRPKTKTGRSYGIFLPMDICLINW